VAESLLSKPKPEWIIKQVYDPDRGDGSEYAGLFIISSFKSDARILVKR
jgi:hypothetical protein